MKRVVEYVSDTVMPVKLRNIIDNYEQYILQSNGERDKIVAYIGNMRRDIINWFAENQKEEV